MRGASAPTGSVMGVARSWFAHLAVVGISVTLTACASFDPHNVIGRHVEFSPQSTATSGTTLSAATRLAAIDAVWTTVNDRYYRADLNGVDWRSARDSWQPRALAAASDDEFWERLDQMAGVLADSHTTLNHPKQSSGANSSRRFRSA